ncbi:MAG: hypothetical protein K0S33_2684 [Bacteroidetes bacterium]|nr:hypothetical protein [Bacteroidota bacterium]
MVCTLADKCKILPDRKFRHQHGEQIFVLSGYVIRKNSDQGSWHTLICRSTHFYFIVYQKIYLSSTQKSLPWISNYPIFLINGPETVLLLFYKGLIAFIRFTVRDIRNRFEYIESGLQIIQLQGV